MDEAKILKNKTFLYITEFFSGVSVMAVELAASRLMAPYFSSSQIVYTIIIGTVMIAMALGNLYGGRSADKNPDPDILYRRLLVSAAWIAAIPLVGRYIILGISGILVLSISTNFLTIAAFASCMIIFVFPLFLLGTVTPSLVKYTVDSLDDSGSVVGRLGACNTIGSILGTFLPTFVTIPSVGTAATFIIFSGVLMAIGLVYFASKKKLGRTVIITLIVFLLATVLGTKASFAFWEDDLTYEGESIYNYLQVKEDDRSVILSTNVLFGIQSIRMKEEGLTGLYYDYALAAPVMAQEAKRVAGTNTSVSGKGEPLKILILGNGSGTFASQCTEYFDGSVIEGVEIDRKITDLALKYFDMPESVSVTTYDGRAYLQTIDHIYDVIMVDAYQDITIPFQMSSVEFFRLVRDHLSPEGVMVVNMNMHSEGEGSINQYLSDTISSVFEDVVTAEVPYTTNIELFATKGSSCAELLEEGSKRLADTTLQHQMQRVQKGLVSYEAGEHILTDDKAPVEVLGMSMIDSLIREELGYYKQIYKDGGLGALLESF
ncbi:MAG: fused MFS/spermidine synthase [Firmicutes bacterium]|nr:fused MFS/spermidine synthase [Bacillota bacterium]